MAEADSTETPLTTEDTEGHGGKQESGGRLQAAGVGLQETNEGAEGRSEGQESKLQSQGVESQSGNGESHSPLPGVIVELQAQGERREVLKQLPLELIDANPYQTRVFTKTTDEDEAGMKELVASIKATGVITPILVRPGKDGRYTLIAGERRTKASRQAGRETIPAIVREVSNQQAAELTVIENLQRENLNCMDQAQAFVLLSQTFQMTQDQIGARVGLSRGTVSNYMRLVRLPFEVQQYLTSEQLTYSHARELLNLENPDVILKVARRAVKEMMSVEQLESLIMEAEFPMRKQPPQLPQGRARWVDPNVRAAQRDLERVLGVKVRIRDRKGKGKITIEYATLEDYDRVIGMLRGSSS
jgi:ParB family chromosome partitioning protein